MNEDRVALVTGASRGIGRGIALRLAADGYRVVANYHQNEGAAAETLAAIEQAGGTAIVYRCDVAEAGAVSGMVADVMARWNRIDVLVNNSGLMVDALVEETAVEEWERVLAVNLNSVFHAAHAVIPIFKRQGGGRIINMSSQAALTGSSRHSHYAAAKAGILGLTYSLAKELGPFGITVNAVSPGRITTEMVTSRSEGRMEEWLRQTPLGRLGTPEEVAAAVAFLASRDAAYITGLNMHVNGGLYMG